MVSEPHFWSHSWPLFWPLFSHFSGPTLLPTQPSYRLALFSGDISFRPVNLLRGPFSHRPSLGDVLQRPFFGRPSPSDLLLRTFSHGPSPTDLLSWTFSGGLSPVDLLPWTFFDGPSSSDLFLVTFPTYFFVSLLPDPFSVTQFVVQSIPATHLMAVSHSGYINSLCSQFWLLFQRPRPTHRIKYMSNKLDALGLSTYITHLTYML